MIKPSSFSTICTNTCSFELVGLLLSLSIYHPNETIYIMCDTKTKESISNITPQPKLNMLWFVELDAYDGMNRMTMEKNNCFGTFLSYKMKIMREALKKHNDTLLLDSDIIITDMIDNIDVSKKIGLSKQYIKQEFIDKTGLYNAGLLWCNSLDVINTWEALIDNNHHCPEQINMEKLKSYEYFEFGENYNLQCWRYYLSNESKEKIASYLSSKDNTVFYKSKPLKFIHTHFLDTRFTEFNETVLQHLQNAKMYKILAIIYRVIHNKWIIKIPRQPIQGMGFHNNDSFREIPVLIKLKNKDVEVSYITNSIHCWLEPTILLYDRPTLEWCNNELQNASVFIMGNGDINYEGKKLQERIPSLPIKPWIFWPRKPMLVEKLLKKGILPYKERTTESIFIGNIENSVQNNFRNDDSWKNVLSEYHCTKGKQHLFTHEEYLMKLRNSKYGLCLRGYGSKCHREVELMAFGTIPLVTSDVNTLSYMEPLVENIHYIKVNIPDDVKNKISTISEEKWAEMSNACSKWFIENIHSDNCWNNMINNILYYQ